jgi:hypothetical protein
MVSKLPIDTYVIMTSAAKLTRYKWSKEIRKAEKICLGRERRVKNKYDGPEKIFIDEFDTSLQKVR